MREQKEVAKRGEIDVANYLLSLPDTQHLLDVSEDKFYQKQDVDFLWVVDNKIIKVEVKTDTYKDTENIVVETISNMNKNKKGCMMYTKADYVFYYFVNEGLCYIIKAEEFKSFFNANKKHFKRRILKTEVNNGIYSSEIYLVNRHILTDILKYKQVNIS